MIPRSVKAEIPISEDGFDDILQQFADQRIRPSTPERIKNRINSAVNGNFIAYPETESLYTVISKKPDNEEQYTVYYNENNEMCDCPDSMFRRFKCKHIWYVRLLIDIGSLPKANVPPDQWLINELQKDLYHVSDQSSRDQLRLLQDLIEDTNSINRDFRKYFRKRAEILSKCQKP